ncbi:hypothetical protein BDQ17DRAFT_136265 [Cyathus striatus]|nr:hypothetical protein BDQ17DRAFT_136265 [Cyathus striatus]
MFYFYIVAMNAADTLYLQHYVFTLSAVRPSNTSRSSLTTNILHTLGMGINDMPLPDSITVAIFFFRQALEFTSNSISPFISYVRLSLSSVALIVLDIRQFENSASRSGIPLPSVFSDQIDSQHFRLTNVPVGNRTRRNVCALRRTAARFHNRVMSLRIPVLVCSHQALLWPFLTRYEIRDARRSQTGHTGPFFMHKICRILALQF